MPQWHYIPTKKYGQNTVEIAFVNLKHLKKVLIFIDLTGFLNDLLKKDSILVVNKSDLLKEKLDPKILKLNHVLISSKDIQFDAAVSLDISNKKELNSDLKGEANVFVFPNLDAGNIGYKIAQELGGYSALGPLLQGINKPIHDLSRGCAIDDIVNVALITSIQKPS